MLTKIFLFQVTVTKKKAPSSSQLPSTSSARVSSKQVTVTPIPPPSPKDTVQSAESPACGSENPPVKDTPEKVVCSVEIKPVKVVTSSKVNEKSFDEAEDAFEKDENKALSERLESRKPSLTETLSQDSSTRNISIEERAKMEPSLQPVVSLKNYRHLAFQSKKSSVSKEDGENSKSSSKVSISPLPFKTGSSLSISPICNKTNTVSVELPSKSGSLSIQPVKLPASTSVNLVKPHPTLSVTPLSGTEQKTEKIKEPSMSITKITEKIPHTSVSITPSSTDTTLKSDSLPSTQSQNITTSNIFSGVDSQKPELTIQPAVTNQPSHINSFGSPIDFSFQPNFQQLPGTRPDFYPGFPRPLGFPTGNFFPPRKDPSGKDLPTGLSQFPSYEATSFLGANPFPATGSNFPGPKSNTPLTPTPRMGQPAHQPPFDTDFSRMYSAFHRPEPQQGTSTSFAAAPTQFNPYPYNPFLMHTGFPLPSAQPNTTPSNPPNPSTQ